MPIGTLLKQQVKDAQVQMQHNTSQTTNSMQAAIDALNWYAEARLSLNQLLVAELPFPTESSKPEEAKNRPNIDWQDKIHRGILRGLKNISETP